MREYIDVTGKNEDEAISKALSQLGLDRDDVSVEVLERAKSGFLGLGACPAKIRVFYGPEEEPVVKEGPPVPAERPETVRKAERRERTERPVKKTERTERPEKAERSEKAERVERVEKVEKVEKKPQRQERTQPQTQKPQRQEPEEPLPVQNLGEEVDDEKAQAIKTFLSGLLNQMESQAEIKVYLPEKGRYKVILEGQGLGALIGRRGETLDAIQQLTSYAVNRTGNRVRIQLDAEGYRAKREQSLQHLARKVAGKVLRYRRSISLEPMNAYERHVIHTALQDYEGVTTYSTGVDPNRHVVVAVDRGERK